MSDIENHQNINISHDQLIFERIHRFNFVKYYNEVLLFLDIQLLNLFKENSLFGQFVLTKSISYQYLNEVCIEERIFSSIARPFYKKTNNALSYIAMNITIKNKKNYLTTSNC